MSETMTIRRSPRWRLARLAAILAAVALVACTEGRRTEVTKADPGPVPPAAQRPGEPETGYDIVVNGGYLTCGMPYAAWSRTARPEETRPNLPGRKGRNTELPYYLTAQRDARGVEIVSANCLLCHGGVFNGEVVIGLGNESLDFTGDPRELVDAVGTYVSGEAATAAWRKWAQRIEAIAPYMITDTVGVNPAPNLTLALMAHRDPKTLAWSDEPLLEPPPEDPLPVSVPPWWRMAKKHAMFYNAMGRKDHARYMMMKSLVCTDDVAEARSIDGDFTNVRAYIASLEPPEYPFAIDTVLADEGETVFEAHCAACHGAYGESPSYPNLVVDLETVGTDPAYALKAYDDSDRFMDWFNRSWYGEIAEARPAPGYIAPPLDGVWATAPYLHNGSVPTIEALLESRRRPTFWTRSFESTDYDPDALGWHYKALDHGKKDTDDLELRRRIYDTTLRGYSNTGHTFGDALSEPERQALIEYLKTL
jgi:mono/diheme cytochrome c family protein